MKRNNYILIIAIIILITSTFSVYSQTIALVGGTVIDVTNFGNSHSDIIDAVVIIEGEKIIAVGSKDTIKIPEDARIINIKGKFVLPGLIDGFAALENQAYANAYLYMGVTSVAAIGVGRRGSVFNNANPGPNIYHFGWVGHVGQAEISEQELMSQIEEWAQKGTNFFMLMYGLKPEQSKLAVEKAHELGMATIGELGYTSYKDAIRYGIDAFIHSVRYSIELAPPDMQMEVAAEPFGPPARLFRIWLGRLDPEEKVVHEYAKILGSSSVALMPTLCLGCIELPFIENPWKEPIANILDPKDIHMPLDKETGKHNLESEIREEFIQQAENILRIEQKYYKAGAKYLAGSGTDVFGTMPGISLHQELELLTKIGLSEREAIAAATNNFAEVFKWKELGQLKAGCRADIIVTDKSPLENIKNLKEIHMVLLKGKIIDRDKLLKIK